ncbi:MAG: S8 family serine peptidase [Candidatus Thermoplasmatota archaeon]|nr:S8 family serine peptidase [Candidatus Thermoplasmatota archaeon]
MKNIVKGLPLFVMIVMSIASMARISTISGSADDAAQFTFDDDMDRIDDRFNDMTFPRIAFIHIASGEDTSRIRKALEGVGILVEKEFSIVDVFLVEAPSLASLERAALIDGVKVIETPTPPVPMMDVSVKAVKASSSGRYSPNTAQDLGYSGNGVTIAFLDTGVDNEHPTFSGAFVAGADFTVPDSPLTPRDGSRDPDDVSGHGTAVASVALGRGDQDGSFAGVAPSAGLIDLRIIASDSNPVSRASANMLEALEWCVEHKETEWGPNYRGVDVISISMGIGPIDGALALAVDSVVSGGIPVVLASGNSGGSYPDQTQTSWPDGAIVVSATDDRNTVDRTDDTFWEGSTRGPRTDDDDPDMYDELKPDISAPGVRITCAMFSRFSNIQGASTWSEGTGTSFSAPHVSGTVALMLESSRLIRPSADRNPVRTLLRRSAEDKGEPYDLELSDTYNVNYGWGMLDSYEALRASRSYTGANSPPEIISMVAEPETVNVLGTVTVTIRARDPDEDRLNYTLTSDAGEISGNGPTFTWKAPSTSGNHTLRGAVTDTFGASAISQVVVRVMEGTANTPPLISSFRGNPTMVPPNGTSMLTTVARDPDGDELTYSYSAELGTIEGEGMVVTYIAPDEIGDDRVTVVVKDGRGGEASRTLTISIRDDISNIAPIIGLIEIYPSTLSANSQGLELVVRAKVEDPDGVQDIYEVTLNLSQLGIDGKIYMADDGNDPDMYALDGIYSAKASGIGPLQPGNYTVVVSVTDRKGAMTMSNAYVRVRSDPGSIRLGSSDGIDPVVMLVSLGVLVLISVMVIVIFLKRPARPSTAPVQPQEARFRPVGPSQG